MTRKLTYLIEGALIFAGGILFGSLATKQKYEKRVDEEIQEMRTAALSLIREIDPEEAIEKAAESVEKDISETMGEGAEKDPPPPEEEPYEIGMDEFGVLDGYAEQTLYFYTEDETLTDEQDHVIEQSDKLIDWDALDIFEDESVEACYVRNEKKQCDYEILRCDGSFKEYRQNGHGGI